MHRMYKVFHPAYVCFLALALILAACQTGSGYNTAKPWENEPRPSVPAEEEPRTLYEYYADQNHHPRPGQEQGEYVPGETAYGQGPEGQPPAPMAPAQDLRPVKVALLVPLSGPHAALGEAMLNAAQLAVFDVGHRQFELLPRDTKGTADGGYEAAQGAVRDGAELLLGPVFAAAVKTAKPVAQSARINMIAFSTDWTLAGGGTYIMGFLPFDQIERITTYAAGQNFNSIGVIAPDTDYGRIVTSSYQAMARRKGINTANIVRFPPGTNNLSPTVRNFTQYDQRLDEEGKETDPNIPLPFDAALMALGSDTAITVANLMTRYDMPPGRVKRLGTGLFDDPALAAEPSLNGAWFAAPSPRLREDFERRYINSYGSRAPRLSTLAYDAAALAAVLAQKGLSQNGRPAFDQNAIANPNGFSGIDGIFRFRRDGTAERGLAILEFRNGRTQIIDDAPKTFQPFAPF